LELILIRKFLEELVDVEPFLLQFEAGLVVKVDAVLVEHDISFDFRLVN
jgi:hypothetical protein